MKNFIPKALFTGLFSLVGGIAVFAQVSTITFDSTFGFNGIAYNTASANFNESMAAMAIQPDGKIISAGASGNAGRITTVIRFLSSGVLDTTFGSGGYVYLSSYYSLQTGAGGVQLLSNGKILVSGASDGTGETYFIARLNSNGSPDSTFGNAGYASFFNGYYTLAPPMVVLADGSIVTDVIDGSHHSFLVKVDSNGIADNSFGINDSLPVTELDYVTNLKLDNSGLILASGTKADSLAIGIVRLLPTGTRDNTFGNNGLVLYSYYDTVYSGYYQSYSPMPIALSNGKILVTFNNQQANVIATIRLLNNGLVDASYGSNGIALSLGQSINKDVLLMDNGELLIAGQFYLANVVYGLAQLAVLTNSGQLDTVFQGNNKSSITFALDTSSTASTTYPASIKLLPGNKILMGGSALPSLSTTGFARFNYSGFLTTGIKPLKQINDMQLFPNPAYQYTLVKYSFNENKQGYLRVFDMLGKLVSSHAVSAQAGSYQLETSGLSNGVYFVELESGNQFATSKLIVQH